MITSLEVENFRGIEKLSLKGLPRVNVLVGPNGCGKTAFLEALLIGSRASPQSASNTWQTRTQMLVLPGGPIGFKIAWGGFFYGQDMSREIVISYTDSGLGQRELRMKGKKAGEKSVVFGQGQLVPAAPTDQLGADITNVEFVRRANDQVTFSYAGFLPQGQLSADVAEPIGPAIALFPAFNPTNSTDNAAWLSDLSVTNGEADVVKTLCEEFPELESVSVLSPGGNLPGIYVGYKSGGDKLPIGSVSSGINKVLTLILASLHYQNGVILIDEIENGIFYRKYEDIWRLLYRLSIQRNNQIFVSSHSLECLNAILPVVSDHPEDFALLRLKSTPGGSSVKKFSGKEFAAALEQDIDPRGNA